MIQRLRDAWMVARLTIKTAWFESISSVVVVGGFTALVLTAWYLIISLGLDEGCLRAGPPPPECDIDKIVMFGQISTQLGEPLLAGAIALPVIIGALLGAPLVAREIDNGTAVLSWSIAQTRVAWFMPRVAVTMAVAVGLMLVPSVATYMLVAARHPSLDPITSFHDYGAWGAILPVRALAVLSVSLFIGSVVGRMLPALVLSAAMGTALVGLSVIALPFWGPSATLAVDASGEVDPGALLVNHLYRDHDGQITDWAGVLAKSPHAFDPASPEGNTAFWTWYEENFELIPGGYAGVRLPEIVFRESVVLLIVSGVSTWLAAFVVSRRRPY